MNRLFLNSFSFTKLGTTEFKSHISRLSVTTLVG